MKKLYGYLAVMLFSFTSLFSSGQVICENTLVSFSLSSGYYVNEVSFYIADPNGTVIGVYNGQSTTFTGTWCLEDGCYTIGMQDSFGDGWNNAQLSIYMMDGTAYTGTFTSGYISTFQFAVNTENCGTPVSSGCMNPAAENYDPLANVDDGSCIVNGCTDQVAMNYNPSATQDDGSCTYCNNAGSVNATLYLCTFGNANNVELEIVNSAGESLAYVYGGNGAIQYVSLCLEPGECYTANMINIAGPYGWYNGYFWVNGNGVQYINASPDDNSAYQSISFSIDGTCGPSYGCTDSTAVNYDAEADLNDGSCQYAGCTDQNAINFDYNASVDDGSCDYCNAPGSVLANLYICTFSNGGQVEFQILDDQGNEVTYVSGLSNGAIYNAQVCLMPGTCYTVNMINNAGPYGWYNGYYWINVNGWQVSNSSLPAGSAFSSTIFSIDGTCGPVFILGCTDPNAINYNAEATDDDGSCEYPVWGCTDPNAANYNANATVDDGSCIIASECESNFVVFSLGGSYWNSEMSFQVIGSNGEVLAAGQGISTTYACLADDCYTIQMYDSFGDGWDNGSLTIMAAGAIVGEYTFSSGTSAIAGFGLNSEGCSGQTVGCTDPNALNYNPAATQDDGSCEYESECTGNLVNIYIQTQNWGSEISWSLIAEDGTVAASGSGYSSWNSYYSYACLPAGCYQMVMNDSWGDGWNGAYYMIYGANTYAEGTLLYGATASDFVGVGVQCGDIAGCTDSSAMNFNPAATVEDGSCMYNTNPFNGETPGILEVEVNLFPNPTNGGMVVDVTNLNATENIRIMITSLEGKVVRDIIMGNEEPSRKFNLDVTDLSAGYYVLSLSNGSKVSVNSFVKN